MPWNRRGGGFESPADAISVYVATVYSRNSIRKHPIVALLVLLLCFVVAAPVARADGKTEAQAKALQKKAMEEDYLTLEFSAANDRLAKALALCGTNKCSATVRAQLHRDMGVVLVGGQLDKDKGIEHFVDAIKADSAVKLDPDVKTKELDAAFEQAKKQAGGASAGGTPAGDFTHTPVTEQLVRTPVPIFVKYEGEETIVKVIVRYKGLGMKEWKPLELKKMGAGWGGTVPCMDVQQGAFLYYVQGFNEANDPAATAGDRNNPYRVPIKTKLDGEPPHLPDQPAPAQCADTGECPPGFPCAKKVGDKPVVTEGVLKGEGEYCDEGSECKSGGCKESRCTAPEVASKGTRVWIGVAGAMDFVFLPSGKDVCKLKAEGLVPQNDSNYYCTTSDGTDYPSRDDKGAQNLLLQPGNAGEVLGGSVPATIRALVSLDYALNNMFLVGGRVGLVLGGYPGAAAGQDAKSSFLKFVHAEGRGTILFHKNGLERKFVPYALVGVGLTETAGKIDIPVTETGTPARRTVSAYAIAGPLFATLGVGIRFALTKKAAIMMAPAKLNVSVGTATLIALQPELGVQFGF